MHAMPADDDIYQNPTSASENLELSEMLKQFALPEHVMKLAVVFIHALFLAKVSHGFPLTESIIFLERELAFEDECDNKQCETILNTIINPSTREEAIKSILIKLKALAIETLKKHGDKFNKSRSKFNLAEMLGFTYLNVSEKILRMNWSEFPEFNEKQWAVISVVAQILNASKLELFNVPLGKMPQPQLTKVCNGLQTLRVTSLDCRNVSFDLLIKKGHSHQIFEAMKKAGIENLYLSQNSLGLLTPEELRTFFKGIRETASISKLLDLSINNLEIMSSEPPKPYESFESSGPYESFYPSEQWPTLCDELATLDIASLHISKNNFDKLTAEQWTDFFAKISKNESLKLISFGDIFEKMTPVSLKAFCDGIKKCRFLNKLNLLFNNFSALTNEQWQMVLEMLRGSSIKEFDMRHSKFSNAQMKELEKINNEGEKKITLFSRKKNSPQLEEQSKEKEKEKEKEILPVKTSTATTQAGETRAFAIDDFEIAGDETTRNNKFTDVTNLIAGVETGNEEIVISLLNKDATLLTLKRKNKASISSTLLRIAQSNDNDRMLSLIFIYRPGLFFQNKLKIFEQGKTISPELPAQLPILLKYMHDLLSYLYANVSQFSGEKKDEMIDIISKSLEYIYPHVYYDQNFSQDFDNLLNDMFLWLLSKTQFPLPEDFLFKSFLTRTRNLSIFAWAQCLLERVKSDEKILDLCLPHIFPERSSIPVTQNPFLIAMINYLIAKNMGEKLLAMAYEKENIDVARYLISNSNISGDFLIPKVQEKRRVEEIIRQMSHGPELYQGSMKRYETTTSLATQKNPTTTQQKIITIIINHELVQKLNKLMEETWDSNLFTPKVNTDEKLRSKQDRYLDLKNLRDAINLEKPLYETIGAMLETKFEFMLFKRLYLSDIEIITESLNKDGSVAAKKVIENLEFKLKPKYEEEDISARFSAITLD